eukprot:4151884-Prymnesium_polylepis.1
MTPSSSGKDTRCTNMFDGCGLAGAMSVSTWKCTQRLTPSVRRKKGVQPGQELQRPMRIAIDGDGSAWRWTPCAASM